MRARAAGALLASALVLATPISARASGEQQRPPSLTELSLEQLGDIEVTSVSKRPEEIWRTAAAVHVITHDDIRRSGATSIPEVLRLAPGVEVARIDSDHWSIGVRGFGDQFSKSLLVLIDGRSIYTPLFAGMYWPAHDALLDDVDRIEVIRGPGGTIWGADAVNGVINIITKSSADTHGTMASAGAGNIDRGAGAVRYGGSRGTAFDYRVYGKGVDRGAMRHADGSAFDEWWTTQAGFRTDWKNSTADTLTVQGDVSRGSHGQRVSVASFSPPSQIPLDGFLDATGVNVLARWQRELGEGRGIRLQAYLDRTSWQAPHFGERRTTVDVDFVHHVTLARRHAFTSGGGVRVSPSLFSQVVSTLDFTPRRETFRVYSGFVEDDMEVVRDRFWVTAGSKVEHNTYTGVEFEPGVRALWTPRAGHSLWSAVTRAVRTPSRIEQSLDSMAYSSTTTVPIYIRITGNPDFDAERTVGFETGYRTRLASPAYLDIAAFHGRHEGLGSFGLGRVTLEQTPAPLHAVANVIYVNGVSGTSDGVELSPDWQPTTWWKLRGSYAYVRFDLRNTPGSIDVNAVNRYAGSSPHHQVRLESHANVAGGGEFDVAFRSISALPAQKVPAYRTVDARVGWALSRRVELSVAGQNLAAPAHAEFGHSQGQPVGIARSLYVAVRFNSRP